MKHVTVMSRYGHEQNASLWQVIRGFLNVHVIDNMDYYKWRILSR